MELRSLVRDLRQNFVAVLAVFALCSGLAFAFGNLPKPQYQASANVLVQPAPSTPSSTDSVVLINYLLPQLPIEATNHQTVVAAGGTLPSSEQGAPVSVSSSSDPGTGIVSVSAASPDPVVAADYANALAEQLIGLQPSQDLYQLVQLAQAQVPTVPDNPPLPIEVGGAGFGVIAGVFAGVGAATIRRRMNRSVEVTDRVGATVMGELPRFPQKDIRPKETFVDPMFPEVVEAFQQLRSNVLLSLPQHRPATVAITSIHPSEGKTSVAAHLAWVLAGRDREVTAIDADLRKPMLHVALGAPFGPGIGAAGSKGGGKVHPTETANPHLEVIPAGIPDRHPSDVIAFILPRLVEELTASGKTVIVDCPPLIGVAETILVAAEVDLVLLVVNSKGFNPERLQAAVMKLQGAGAKHVAVILNRVRRSSSARRENYGYTYDYLRPHGRSDTIPPESSPLSRRRVSVADKFA